MDSPNLSPGMSSNEAVQVVVRCRPLSDKETGSINIIKAHPKRGVIEVQNPRTKVENERTKIFTFDAVYDWECTQQTLYDETVRPLVSSVLDGYNGCVFAYGQTGTGKTFTMEGSEAPGDQGVILRAFQQIWAHINRTTGVEFLVTVRYLEIYMEEIRDLLKPKPGKLLELREDIVNGMYVTHLHSHICQSEDDMFNSMKIGNINRTTGPTNMNDHSSRSHAIFQIIIEMGEGPSKSVKVGKLNLVDLAGSERQSKTGATGDRLKEATKINKALSSLGNVIYALAETSGHIPYRDSKLTRLLQDSLGGNSKTIMIANIGPSSMNYDETIITLRYAYRAKSIKNQPIKNEDMKNSKLVELQEEIGRLKKLIDEKNKGMVLTGEIELDVVSSGDEDTGEKEEKVKKLELGKVEVSELAKQLKTLENQMVHGGNLVDSVKENEFKLEEQRLKIAARKKLEIEIQQKIEEEEENCQELLHVFASLQQAVDFKREKLKRLYAKLHSVKQEIKDAHEDYVKTRKEIEESNDSVSMQLRKKFLMIDNFVPTEERTRLLNLAGFDDNLDNWVFNREQYKLNRPLAHNYRRPISDYAIHHAKTSPKYRGENILDLKLDMPLRTTLNYSYPSVCPQIKAFVSNIIRQESQNNHIVVKLPAHVVGLKGMTSKIEKDGKYKQAVKNIVEVHNQRRQSAARPVF